MASFNYKQEYERYKAYYLSLEPMLNKPTNRAYTAVIFSFLAVSLFGWYAIRPTMQTIFTLKREISDRTEVDKKMEDKISALIEAQANYENIQGVIPVLSQALPMDPEALRAVAQIRGLASENGLTLDGLTVPPGTLRSEPGKTKLPAEGKIEIIPLSFSVTGGYANIKTFLQGLANLRRINQVVSLSFSPQNEPKTASGSAKPAAAGTFLQVDLKLNVFYVTH